MAVSVVSFCPVADWQKWHHCDALALRGYVIRSTDIRELANLPIAGAGLGVSVEGLSPPAATAIFRSLRILGVS